MSVPLPPALKDRDALLRLAHALEAEAARRYGELADRMAGQAEVALADLFRFLARLEEKHGQQVAERAGGQVPSPPDPTARWDVPENFDEEAARSARLSPYAALAIAVRNEERAFAFYCHAAACGPPDVAALAEDLARDELQHAALLRGPRRAAWRQEGKPSQISALPDSLAALRAWVARLRIVLARISRSVARQLDDTGDHALAEVFDRIAAEANPAIAATDRIAGVRDGLKALEEAFEQMTDIAARSQDSEIVHEAQAAAEVFVRWLALAGGAHRNTLLQSGQ